MNYNFNFGDIVEYIGYDHDPYNFVIRGIVTKANSKEFFVKWIDGGVSNEQQDNPVGIIKVQDNA